MLGEELGAGGMGRVFRATHARMRREVALKVVSRRGMRSADAARRFAREVEVAAKLIHPNVAIAHDAREQDGVVYLILEYVAGTDLARLVKERGPLGVAEAVDYVTQAARGLAYAHGRGVVHRDVKPANLMIDGEGVVKVLDLGLSRLRDEVDPLSPVPGAADESSAGSRAGGQMTQAGDVLGTVDFVAPEQAQSPRDADRRADVYGLGCTLYYLLTGRGAFAHGSTAACVLLLAIGGAVWWHGHLESQRSPVTGVPVAAATQRGAQPQLPVMPFGPAVAVRHRDLWREYVNCPAEMTNSIGMKFAFISPGEYQAGEGSTVRVTRPYYMGANEVTIGQMRAFVRESKYRTMADRDGGVEDAPGGFKVRPGRTWENPGYEHTDDFPALQLSHSDLEALARWLTAREMREKRVYRVPAGAQWAWAAQAGTPAPDLWYAGEDPGEYGWTRSNSGKMPHAVGTRRPNPWGLYDVRGNAAEWCADFRDTTPEPPLMGVLEDPAGPPNGRLRILLGSSFANEDPYTAAGNATPTMRYPTWGGRLTCEIDGAPRAAAATRGSGTGKWP